jgi:hypothetical protein
MSVVKLDDKQKKGINPLISGMIARVKTTAIERAETERTKGMRRGTILKSVKIKTFLLKPIGSK